MKIPNSNDNNNTYASVIHAKANLCISVWEYVCILARYKSRLGTRAWGGNTIRSVLCVVASSFPHFATYPQHMCTINSQRAAALDWGHYVAHAWNRFIALHSHDMDGQSTWTWTCTWTWTRNSNCNEWQMQIRFPGPSCQFLLINPLINNGEHIRAGHFIYVFNFCKISLFFWFQISYLLLNKAAMHK